MLKRILTSLLALCMVLTTFVAVSAEDAAAEDVTVVSINENYDSGNGATLAGSDITLTTGTAGGRDGVLIINSTAGTGAYGLAGFAVTDTDGTQLTISDLPEGGVITYSIDVYAPADGNVGDANFYLRTKSKFPPDGMMTALNSLDNLTTGTWKTYSGTKNVADCSWSGTSGDTAPIWICIRPNFSAAGTMYVDNFSFTITAPAVEETPEEELPPFRDTPNPASGVTLATEAEIATLGDLPEGIGTIYKKTVTIGSGGQTTCELLYYPNALIREGAYDLKVFLFEPTTNPATDGTGLHRMLRYSRFSTSHSWKGDIAYVMYDQNARMGVWNTYDGTVNIDKSNAADAYTTDRIGFRWVLGNDGWKGGADHPYPDIIGETATLYFSISLTSGVKPDKATAVIETTKWSGENMFDEAGYLASAGAVKETVGGETVISAGTNYTLVQSALDLSWDPSALYRISFKARGDGTSTYTSNGRVQFRTNAATEFTGTIPAADLATGNWNEYSMICDMSTLEQTFKDGNTMLCDRGTTTWWLMLRRGSSSEGPVYYKDIVFEKAVPTATGETPVYTSAIFTFENNSLETLSIPQGTLILAEYNSDGSFNRAITKSFVKNAQTFTLKKQNTADSETYEGQVGGIIPDSTGAVRLDIPGYDSTKTYQLMIWDSVAGMNSLFGVTASK